MLDVSKIKKDFPILERKINGKDLVFLDSAASSQKPNVVIETLREYYRTYNANVHRGIYTLSEEASSRYEGSRVIVQKFINARKSEEIIFTRNATESINLVAYSWGRAFLKEGDEIIISAMEHHSNIVPWQILAKEKGLVIRVWDITDDGYLKIEKLEKLINKKTKLLAITHVSNVLGTINPIKEIVKIAHRSNIKVAVDGAQSVPHMSVDVQSLDCDFLAFSGHKMLGPTGIGVLYGKEEILEKMPPFMGGGGMIKVVKFSGTTFAKTPLKFEAGTPNIADAIGLGATVTYLEKLGMENIREHEKEITEYALSKLSKVKGVSIFGPKKAEDKGGVIAFNVNGVHAHDVSTIVNEEGVAIRAGHHCAQPLMERLGQVATARASFYVYTTKDDVDVLINSLEKVKKVFKV